MKDLSQLFDITVSAGDLKYAVEDEYGVLYSEDGWRLLECRNPSLRHYRVKEGCKIICEKAFFRRVAFNCALEEVTLPEGVLAIGNAAFMCCARLHRVELPESLRCIGENAFYYCSALHNITLPSGLTVMEGNPWVDSGLTAVESRSPHFRMEDGCLMEDDKLVAVLADKECLRVPAGTKKIGSEVLHPHNHVRELLLPDGLEEIGNNAFQGCDLQQLRLPASVKKIGDNPFSCCKVGALTVEGDAYVLEDGCLISDKGVLVAYLGEDPLVVVPERVSEIGAGAFYENERVAAVVLPAQLRRIRHHAFDGCRNLATLEIPECVARIEEGAFMRCRQLRTLTLPQGLPWVDDSLFEGAGLTELVIPEGVRKIGDRAFAFCRQLQSVSIPKTVWSIGDGAFEACQQLRRVVLPNPVVGIGREAFAFSRDLEIAVAPASPDGGGRWTSAE